jgi:hypothetical protein
MPICATVTRERRSKHQHVSVGRISDEAIAADHDLSRPTSCTPYRLAYECVARPVELSLAVSEVDWPEGIRAVRDLTRVPDVSKIFDKNFERRQLRSR